MNGKSLQVLLDFQLVDWFDPIFQLQVEQMMNHVKRQENRKIVKYDVSHEHIFAVQQWLVNAHSDALVLMCVGLIGVVVFS